MSRPMRTMIGAAAKRLQFPLARPGLPRRIDRIEGSGGGNVGRVQLLQRSLTALTNHERLELPYPVAEELRGYAERLIQEAVKYGDTDPATMELACFWLTDKAQVHKLFKVLVPRYQRYNRSYTVLHALPRPQWPDPGSRFIEGYSVIELRDNPWPPVDGRSSHKITREEKSRWLINILVEGARADFFRDKMSENEDNPPAA